MKRKSPVTAATLQTAEPEPVKHARCEVCGAEANPNPTEQLFWVCRRLKISAWRDVEQQAPVQE